MNVFEPSLKDSSDFLVALMVLQQIEADNELEPLLYALKARLDKAGKDANPYHLLNTLFSYEAILESKSAYGEIWEAVYRDIATANFKATLPYSGFSQAEIDSLPAEVVDHFATVSLFEERFPDEGSRHFPLAARLKDGKDMLFDALGSEAGKSALSAASWGISLATGGIVTRLAIKGGAALATKLIQNEAVQSFASKVQGRVTNFLQRSGVPTGRIATHLRDFKDTARDVMASETFQRYGKPSLALAGMALGALMMGTINHDKLIDLASSAMGKGDEITELASQAVDTTVTTVTQTIDHVVDTSVAGLAAAYQDPMGTLNDLARGAADVAKDTGHALSEGADSVLAAAFKAPGAISDGIGQGYNAAVTLATDSIDHGRAWVADTLHKSGDLVAGSSSGNADDVIKGKQLLTDAVPPTSPVTDVGPSHYQIQKGDSLWKISKEHLEATGITPTNQQIHEATQKLYEANKDLVGMNPDKIFTGRELRIDSSLFESPAAVDSRHASLSQALGTKPGFAIETDVAGSIHPGVDAAAPQAPAKSDMDSLKETLNSPHQGSVTETAKRVGRTASEGHTPGF